MHVDSLALAFTAGIALLTGVLFGLVPALQMSVSRPQAALNQNARGSTDGARTAWIRRALVVGEVALASILLVTAGLLIRSFARVLDVDLGFRPERLAVLRVEPGADVTTPEQRNTFHDEIVRRIEAVPGIESAALTDALPLDRNRTWGIAAKGETYAPGQVPIAFVRVVSRGYFKTMGIPIRAGEDFTGREVRGKDPVMIVNETAGKRLWPNQNPIGRIATLGRRRLSRHRRGRRCSSYLARGRVRERDVPRDHGDRIAIGRSGHAHDARSVGHVVDHSRRPPADRSDAADH